MSADGDLSLRPEPGTISVCAYCGHVSAFAEDLTLRPLTDEEIRALAGDRKLLTVQAVCAAVRKQQLQ